MSRTLTTTIARLAAAVAVASAAFAGATVDARAETVSIPVPKVLVIGALNTLFASTQVRLDSYGERHVSGRYLSWLEKNGSTVTIAGMTRALPLEEIDRKTTKTRRLRAYVNDIRATALMASQDGMRIRLSALFESGGDEIKIKCLRYRVLKKDWKDECVIPSLAGKGMQIDNALLEARLTPIAHKGSISFTPHDVDFSATIQAGGLCGLLDGLCTRITDYKNKTRRALEDNVHALLGRDDLRDLVGQRVRTALEQAGILEPDWKVTAISDAGASYSITVERPDQIDAGSVKIGSFTPMVAHVKHTCPVNVGFRATVWTQYDLSGRAWLEHENGSTSPKLQWTAKKGAVTTSTVARAFSGQKGQTYANRWSRLVVEWKDQKGTVFTTKSAKAPFKVTCLEPGMGFTG
jgi:hypothetical protein